MNLHLSEASGPDCIPVVVLKNCESKLSYISAELFNKCLKESCIPDCWKVSAVVPVFKNLRAKVNKQLKTTTLFVTSLLSVVSKVFEKLLNKRIVDHLKKCGIFSDFQYRFRSSRSNSNLLTVILIELLGLLTDLVLLELWNLIYPRFLKLKACVRPLFLKDKCISSLFRTKYIEKKFNPFWHNFFYLFETYLKQSLFRSN